MKFSKEEKAFVIWWIDRQFANNPLFPAKCIAEDEDGKPGVTKGHVKAYKAWSKTVSKRSQIQEWIDQWLNKADKKSLKDALEARAAQADESDESSK